MVMCRLGEVTVEVQGPLPNVEIKWSRSQMISVMEGDDLPKGELQNGTWIMPGKWNQGCFDAIYYHSVGVVDVIQVTIAKKKHDYKLAHLKTFLENLCSGREKNSVVRFVVLVPPLGTETFKISKNDVKNPGVVSEFHAKWSYEKMLVAVITDDVIEPSPKRPRETGDHS